MLPNPRKLYEAAGLLLLLIIISLQLFFSVRRESQTWDEANHIYAGYLSLTNRDFGLNPEHPPLVKLLATSPLLGLQLKTPVPKGRFFKEDAFLDGKDFLYQNDAEKILSRTRTAAAILTLLTALVVFFGTREMFGTGAAFIALTLLAFDPNLLAHGAFVTTDVGLACFMFLSVFLFYRFLKSPSALRLIMTGAAVGLVMAVKHTGLLILPMLFLLGVCEVALRRETLWRRERDGVMMAFHCLTRRTWPRSYDSFAARQVWSARPVRPSRCRPAPRESARNIPGHMSPTAQSGRRARWPC